MVEVRTNPSYVPAQQDASPGASGASGIRGSLGGMPVDLAPFGDEPARPSGIGARIADFFRHSLPQVVMSVVRTVLSPFVSGGEGAPAPAQPAPPPAFDPAANAAISGPFSDARVQDFFDQLRSNIDPQSLDRDMSDIGVSGRNGVVVNNAFALDLNRATNLYRFDDAPIGELRGIPADSSSSDPGQFPRVQAWCDAMEARGVSDDDMLVITRVVNQSTFGLILDQNLYRQDLAPPLSTPGGDVILVSDFDDRDWNIARTESGFDVTFAGSGPFRQAPSLADGSTVHFGEGTSVSATFTVRLERDRDGALQLADIRDCSTTVAAFDERGNALV